VIKIPPNLHLLLELASAGKIPDVYVSHGLSVPEALNINSKPVWIDGSERLAPENVAWLEKKIRDAIHSDDGTYCLSHEGMTACSIADNRIRYWMQKHFNEGDSLQRHIDAAWYVLGEQ
jgi:hypothetical protein